MNPSPAGNASVPSQPTTEPLKENSTSSSPLMKEKAYEAPLSETQSSHIKMIAHSNLEMDDLLSKRERLINVRAQLIDLPKNTLNQSRIENLFSQVDNALLENEKKMHVVSQKISQLSEELEGTFRKHNLQRAKNFHEQLSAEKSDLLQGGDINKAAERLNYINNRIEKLNAIIQKLGGDNLTTVDEESLKIQYGFVPSDDASQMMDKILPSGGRNMPRSPALTTINFDSLPEQTGDLHRYQQASSALQELKEAKTILLKSEESLRNLNTDETAHVLSEVQRHMNKIDAEIELISTYISQFETDVMEGVYDRESMRPESTTSHEPKEHLRDILSDKKSQVSSLERELEERKKSLHRLINLSKRGMNNDDITTYINVVKLVKSEVDRTQSKINTLQNEIETIETEVRIFEPSPEVSQSSTPSTKSDTSGTSSGTSTESLRRKKGDLFKTFKSRIGKATRKIQDGENPFKKGKPS